MSDGSANACIAFVLLREQGLSINPDDRGGVTKFGITLPVLSQYTGRQCSSDDIRALTAADARKIYKKLFWDDSRFDLLDSYPAVQLAAFDFAVNSGPGASIRTLQNYLASAMVPCTADGLLGPETTAGLDKVIAGTSELFVALGLTRARRMLMARICERDKSQSAFIVGWISRTHAVDTAIPTLAKSK